MIRDSGPTEHDGPDEEARAAANLRGILFMIGAAAAFAVGDTIMKLLAGTVPTSELILIRGIFVFGGAIVAAYVMGAFAVLHRALTGAMALRAAGDTGGAWCFQLALARMPYSDLSAIGQLTPLTITAASALIFRERVGWRRWTATAIGLMGVLLIIRPGSSTFNWWAIAGVGAVLASTTRDLATRRVDPTVPPPIITMLSSGLTVVTSLFVSLSATWVAPPLWVVGGLFCAAIFSLLGQSCTIIAVRSGDISAVVPFRYAIIIFAIVSGIFVFGHFPDPLTLTGIVIVCTAGLYTFYREQTLRRIAAATGARK
ncbi:MAG: DMT family transporter [Hyphomicrobiaceae bacterium]